MGTTTLISSIFIDIGILVLYFINPVIQYRWDWVKEDVSLGYLLNESIFDIGIFTILRMSMFIYLVQTNRFYSSTRCIVFSSLLIELAFLSIAVLQICCFLLQPGSFQRYRSTQETRTLFLLITVLFFSNSLIQMVCILRINQQRNTMASMEEEMFDKILGVSTSPAQQKMKQRNLWRNKWRKLTRHFSKQSEPFFASLLRLYAHKQGAIQRLAAQSHQDPLSFEFYIPQLCSFLLLGVYLDSPQLCIILLDKCSEYVHQSSSIRTSNDLDRSHIFAQKMRWFLKSFCVGGTAYMCEERMQRVNMLIEEVEQRGQHPSRRLSNGNGPGEESKQEKETLEPEKNYNTFTQNEAGLNELEPFYKNVKFITALTDISTELKKVSYRKRNQMLVEKLRQVQERFFPSNCLFMPVGNALHRVKHLHTTESFTFSTRTRVPYLLCVEVIDYAEIKRRKGLAGIRDLTRSFFGAEEDLIHHDGHGYDEAVSASSPRLDEAEKLGFWCEPKAENRPGILDGIMESFREKQSKQEVKITISGFHGRSDDLELGDPLSSPECSPLRLHRVDSTEKFLRSHHDEDMAFEAEETPSPMPTVTPQVVFSERWDEKEARIRRTSPWGSIKGWRLLPVIVKSDDDLRQEQFASQLIHQFSKIFNEAHLPVWVRPYDVIATSPVSGLVEAIPDTISLDSLKRNDPQYTSLLDFFIRHFGEVGSPAFRQARKNFVKSMAAYSIICYLLQIKDRHNGNILLHAEGYIVHIDFGFILANNPGNMHFESAPFKLTQEFVQLMGGPRSASFRRFRSLCVRAFLVARKCRHRITLLVEMMLQGNEEMSCFAGTPRATVDRLMERFQPELNTHECENFVHELIDTSLDNWRTRWYDKYQRWIVGVF